MKNWFVYLLECADGTYYTGCTKDLKRRLHAHNHLKAGAKYTRTRRPVKLVYSEEHFNQSSAMKRELEIKTYNRAGKKKLISEK